MVDIATLGLVVRSDGVVIAGKRLRDFKDDAGRADNAAKGLNATFTKLASLAGVVAGSFLVKGLVQMTSAWSDLQGRVDLAAGSMEAGAKVMERIESIARRTYSDLSSTADSYLANATALRELGLTTEQALDYTEALNNAMVVSGAKAERAASVQNALSKAMGLGKLSGENLNTILASGGRIAELLAEELGTTTVGLRKMGEEGKITSDVIQRTLLTSLPKLREEADSMAATMLDGMMLIGNSLLGFVGRADAALGVGENVASMFVSIADAITNSTEPAIAALTMGMENLPRLLSYATAFGAFWAGPYVAAMVASRVATFTLAGALTTLRGALVRTGVGALVVLLGEMIFHLVEAGNKTGAFGEAVSSVGSVVIQVFTKMWETVEALQVTFEAAALAIESVFIGAFASIYTSYANLVNLIGTGLNMIGVKNTANMDPTWATNTFNRVTAEAALAGEEAALRWAKVFGAKVPQLVDVDGIVNGLAGNTFDSVDEMFASLGGTGTTVPTQPGAGGGAAKEDQFKRATDAIREQTEALQHQATALGMTDFEATKYLQSMELLNAATAAGKPITAGLIAEIDGLASSYAAAEQHLKEVQAQIDLVNQMNDTLASGFADMFKSAIDGSKSLGESLGGLLSQLGSLLINNAFKTIFSGGGAAGGFLGGLFSFEGGGTTGSGPRTGGVDGKGGFLSILHPDETVIDHTRSSASNDNGSGGKSLSIVINGSGLSEEQLSRAIAQAIRDYDSELAGRVENKVRVMQQDPRAADGNW